MNKILLSLLSVLYWRFYCRAVNNHYYIVVAYDIIIEVNLLRSGVMTYIEVVLLRVEKYQCGGEVSM